ncbi:hypothetical protein STHU_04200 [Allostella humosa]|nr:RT0821/Lpp0805 family surface protein [Stella humosa]BBK29786.1 hypothetical protein STHU_04200 [Stella humosa]
MTLVLLLALGACDGGEKPGAAPTARTAVSGAAAPGTAPLLAIFGAAPAAPALGEGDRQQVQAAERRAFAVAAGQPVHWQNPRTGAFGEIVALGPAERRQGQLCRSFRHKVLVAGRSQEATGTACARAERAGGESSGANAGQQG